MNAAAYFLSAVVGDKPGSLEIRTAPYSHDRLAQLLAGDSTAIAIAPEGAFVAERLLQAFHASPPPTLRKHHYTGWVYYSKGPSDRDPHRVTSFHSPKYFLDRISRLHWENGSPKFHVVALIREGALSETKATSFLRAAIDPPRARRIIIRNSRVANSKSEVTLESKNRDLLRQVRDSMLSRVKTYSSVEVATVCDSANVNPSQYASDLRRSNRIFAVRKGRDWLYPTFQFDNTKNPAAPFAEMKEILTHLTPDERGWDRLQWFLDPNIDLGGRAPLQLWKEDRTKVVKAAQSEQWNARD